MKSDKNNKMPPRWLIVTILALMLGGALIYHAISILAGPRTISVNGECMATAPRDRTAITLRIVSVDKSASESMRRATSMASEITEYVRTLDAKMQTTQFNSYEKTEWDRNAQRNISMGIETTIAIEVSAPSINTIESVLNKFASRENIYPENLRMFTATETMQPIIMDCMARATENARVRANALAAGDKKRAGRILSLSYNTTGGGMVRPLANFARTTGIAKEAAAMDVAGSIVSNDTEMTVSVSAIFEIK